MADLDIGMNRNRREWDDHEEAVCAGGCRRRFAVDDLRGGYCEPCLTEKDLEICDWCGVPVPKAAAVEVDEFRYHTTCVREMTT